MKFRSTLLTVLAAGLLMPAAVLAEETAKPAKEATAEKAEAKKAEVKKADSAKCAEVTGSRIKPTKTGDCQTVSNRPIRTYTSEELQNTGEMDLASALKSLDPSIR
jgi:hypothetical protein